MQQQMAEKDDELEQLRAQIAHQLTEIGERDQQIAFRVNSINQSNSSLIPSLLDGELNAEIQRLNAIIE